MPELMEAAYEAAALALASPFRDSQHGQHCPVWTQKADVARCDCWILRQSRTRAELAVDAVRPPLIAEGRRQAVEAIRARVGDIAAVEWAALIVEEEGRG